MYKELPGTPKKFIVVVLVSEAKQYPFTGPGVLAVK
jgi:hypothetical protein